MEILENFFVKASGRVIMKSRAKTLQNVVKWNQGFYALDKLPGRWLAMVAGIMTMDW